MGAEATDESVPAEDERRATAGRARRAARPAWGDVLALAFLAAIAGGIGGWLLGSGVIPIPGFLPLEGRMPPAAALIMATGAAMIGGLAGWLGSLSDWIAETTE